MPCGLLGELLAGIDIGLHVSRHIAARGELRVDRGRVHRSQGAGIGTALHDHIGRAFAHHLVRGGIDLKRDVGHFLAVNPGAGQQQRMAGIELAVIADIGLVGVARDHHIDARIERIEDRADFPGEARTAVGVVGIILLTALMDQHHDRVCTLGLEQRNQRVDRRGFTRKAQPLYPVRRDQIGGALQGQPDDAHPHGAAAAAEGPDRVGREQRLAALGDRAGGEELEPRSAEFLDLAGLARRQLRAAAALHPQQFITPTVEFVIANRVEIEPDAVGDPDRRFIEIDRRGQLRGADQIARRYRQVVAIFDPQAIDRAGQIGRAAGRNPHDAAKPIGSRNRLARRLERAVKIVDRQDSDRHRSRGGGRFDRARRHAGGHQREQQCRKEVSESRSAEGKSGHAPFLAEPGHAASQSPPAC